MRSTCSHALAIALATSCCTLAHAQTAPAPDAIVFERFVTDPQTGTSATSLFLTDPDGLSVQPLTPAVAGVHDRNASWSPDGTLLAFERSGSLGGEIMLTDRTGTRVKRITHGMGDFSNPVWGPRSLIAFESAAGGSSSACLSVIGVPQQRQRELFCATDVDGDRTEVMSPTWSADGASVYVATSHPVGRLGEAWYGDVYRVDVATGAATLLVRANLDDQSESVIAPDGKAAVFKRSFTSGPMTKVDLTDGSVSSLGGGNTPVFSTDGQRIAFVRTVFVGQWPDLLVLDQIFVVNTDGTNVQQVTDQRDEQVHFATLDWSADGTRLLVSHWTDGDGTRRLATVDIATGEFRALPEGMASEDAWFDR